MNDKYMKSAIKEATKALQLNEMPVGCAIVYKNKIISKGCNQKEKKKDSTMHAEIIAIKKACKKINDWRLNDCVMYVTLEPCTMCMGAIIESRIKTVVCGVKNNKYNITNKRLIKKGKINVCFGCQKEIVKKQLKTFFKTIRNK